jgi:hypothetical protein
LRVIIDSQNMPLNQLSRMSSRRLSPLSVSQSRTTRRARLARREQNDDSSVNLNDELNAAAQPAQTSSEDQVHRAINTVMSQS